MGTQFPFVLITQHRHYIVLPLGWGAKTNPINDKTLTVVHHLIYNNNILVPNQHRLTKKLLWPCMFVKSPSWSRIDGSNFNFHICSSSDRMMMIGPRDYSREFLIKWGSTNYLLILRNLHEMLVRCFNFNRSYWFKHNKEETNGQCCWVRST